MPTAQLLCVGLSHRTAPVELRERLSCLAHEPEALLAERPPALQELLVLSTCNRLELYASHPGGTDTDPREMLAALRRLMARRTGVPEAEFADHLYCHTGLQVAEHLFRVAAGLDSLVLGESQILGQITQTYNAAAQTPLVGPVLHTLFRAAIRTGKRARTETAIGTNPASISSVAIALAEKRLGDLRSRHVAVVGLGEMGRLATKGLAARQLSRVTLLNRTVARAQQAAAQQPGWEAGSLADLPQMLASADVVVSATATPAPIITAEMVHQAMAQRPERPLLLLDLAVPRDVEPTVALLPQVFLYDVDDLMGSLDAALSARRQEVPRVEAIIGQEMAALELAMRELAMRPVVVDLRQKAEAIRQAELARALRHLGDVDPAVVEQLHHFSRALVNKLLHEPTVRLKEQAQNGQAEVYASTVRDLFGLTEPGTGEAESAQPGAAR
ncbi:glutamyl-tRNA reductase [Litorilinea aerophila]|nr:glutamyl-tRNA reductase [Litorilinea aerophila]